MKTRLPKIISSSILNTMLLLLFVCITSSLHSQQKKIDSLKSLLTTAKTDTATIELYEKLGDAYYLEKKMDSSVLSFQHSLEINKKYNYSLQRQLWNIAAIDYRLYEMGNYIESIHYAINHLALGEKINDTSQQGGAHLVFGHDYKSLGYYREALSHYFKARKIFKLYWERRTGKEDNTYTFLCIGETYLKMNQLDSALLYTRYAVKLAQTQLDGGYVLLSTRLLGDIAFVKGDTTTALQYYRKYIPDFVKYQEKNRDLGFVLNKIAGIFQKNGQTDSVIFYAKKALQNAEQFDDQQNLFTAGMLLSDAYKGNDDHAAFNYLKIANAAKDSMISSDKLKETQILLFNEQQKEKEEAAAEGKERAKYRSIIIIAAILIAITSFLLWHRIRQLRLKHTMILEQKESEKLKAEYNLKKAQMNRQIFELEAKALRAQMNPHFIFNCMNSIKSLIQKNEQEKSILYLTTFSKLIRTIFQNSDKREISLFDEIETCRLYTQLESMRFSNKFSYAFNIDKTLDLKSIMVPALIVQPYIENAIWHGIMPKENGGMVMVTVDKTACTIRCTIDDDGIGREMSKQNRFLTKDLSHESKGVYLTQARLHLDNLLNERNAKVEIIDKKDVHDKSCGTTVVLCFDEY